MKTMIWRLCACMLISASVVAHTDSLIVDQYFSPFTGAALNLSAYHAYMFADDKYLPSSNGEANLGWFIGRTGKLYFETLMSSVLMVVQHEIFGHGYRCREYHFSNVSYEIGIGWGSTGFSDADFNALSFPKRAALSAAGMEANAILSQEIRAGWILQNEVDRREGVLYLLTYLDQSLYILGTSDESTNQSNDVNGYVTDINAWYGNTDLTKGKLRSYALWDFLDPSLYVGMYSMVQYLSDGTPQIPLYMFDFDKFKYTFCARLLLAPYGPEFQLQNYILTSNCKLWQVNFRYGNNSNIQSYGIDLWTKDIWRYDRWIFGNKLFIWKQPAYLSQNTSVGVANNLGAADFVSAEYRMNNSFSALGEVGYKTDGYIQGNPLGSSIVWRLGITLHY